MPKTIQLPTAPVKSSTSMSGNKPKTKKSDTDTAVMGPGSTLQKLKETKPKYYSHLSIRNDDSIAVTFDTMALKTIPDEVFLNEQVQQALVAVNLSNNKIKKIPATFAENLLLREIDLSANLIKKIPPGLLSKLKDLKILKITDNQIKTIPRTLAKAESLDQINLSANLIKKLPPTIGNAIQVSKINLSKNSIAVLPKTIYNLRRELDVSENRIESLPLIKETKKIKLNILSLILDKNNISELPENIHELYHLERLSIAENSLIELPHNFGDFMFLSNLNLSGNKLVNLPDSFGQLGNCITELNLRGNRLERLPSSIMRFVRVRIMNISDNNVQSLPGLLPDYENFGRDLVSLDVSNNALSSCDTWINNSHRFPSLEVINFKNNEINSLDDECFAMIKNLVVADFSSNHIAYMPDSISACQRLKILRFANNKLAKLSNGLGINQLLEELDVSGNAIEDLPNDLRNKFHDTRVLKLSGNIIRTIERQFHHLQRLEELWVDHNILQYITFPASRNLKILKIGGNIDLEHGKIISKLPTSLFSNTLTRLDLSGSGIQDLPVQIGQLVTLTQLDLSGNKLGPDFGEKISKLRRLETLNLKENKLKKLDVDLSNLRNLTHFDISENEFREFDETVLTKMRRLHRLDCSNNQIEAMPTNFGDLNELQELNLDGNRLLEFPNDKIDVMGSLKHLSINNNYIESFPVDLPYLYRMERLNAKNNNIDSLPADLWKMKSLDILDVSGNMLTELPESIAKLASVKQISFSENKIASFPTAVQSLQQKGVKIDISLQDRTKSKRIMPSLDFGVGTAEDNASKLSIRPSTTMETPGRIAQPVN